MITIILFYYYYENIYSMLWCLIVFGFESQQLAAQLVQIAKTCSWNFLCFSIRCWVLVKLCADELRRNFRALNFRKNSQLESSSYTRDNYGHLFGFFGSASANKNGFFVFVQTTNSEPDRSHLWLLLELHSPIFFVHKFIYAKWIAWNRNENKKRKWIRSDYRINLYGFVCKFVPHQIYVIAVTVLWSVHWWRPQTIRHRSAAVQAIHTNWKMI